MEILEDCNKVIEYFIEIIDFIIDRYFYVKILFFVLYSFIRNIYFYGGMKSKEKIYIYFFEFKYEYMRFKI